jgi:flagellar protein FliS
MFATAYRPLATQRSAATYQQMQVTTGVAGASPHGLIAMLYEGLQGAIAEARGAIARRDVPAKGRAIGRAIGIVNEGLSAALDIKAGGDLALRLDSLYRYVALRLTQANLHSDSAALEECSRLVDALQEGWAGIADRVPA